MYRYVESSVLKIEADENTVFHKKKVPIFSRILTYTIYPHVQEKRVHPIRGDLTKDAGLFRKKRKSTISVAPFTFPMQKIIFRTKHNTEDFYQMYFDEKSMILRTKAISKTDYRYYVQSADIHCLVAISKHIPYGVC